MQKTATITEYSFDNFAEMVDFLKSNPLCRQIRYQEDKLLVMTRAFSQTSFYINECPNDECCSETTNLDDYFDEDGNPDNEAFAEDYDIRDFRGEEYIKEAHK